MDTLISNVTVVTMNPKMDVLFGAYIGIADGKIVTATNNTGGILGGISNGMPVIFSVAFKAPPSIACTQNSVSLAQREEIQLNVKGRHDPCIVPRAVPVVEAAAAIAIYDLILGNTQTDRRKT